MKPYIHLHMIVSTIFKQLRAMGCVTLLLLAFFTPTVSHAGILDAFTGKVKNLFLPNNEATDTENTPSYQTMPALKPIVVDDNDVIGAIVPDASSSQDALSATSGSLRLSTEEIDFPINSTISVYEVKKGDTLAGVAKLFSVSKNTILWANDLKSEKLTPGDTLVILPITGIKHTVKKGDTLLSVAKKYKADASDIAKFNGISPDEDLSIGSTVLVPEGELAVTVTTTTKTKTGKVIITQESLVNTYPNTTPSGFLVRPISGGRKTQGLHGHNAVDLAAPLGTPVIASGSGRVILAKVGGYNGGYGNMIIISHDGGVQTVYAHLKQVNVLVGQAVSQGQIIGQVGSTGHSTGPHIHFEVRGAVNPF